MLGVELKPPTDLASVDANVEVVAFAHIQLSSPPAQGRWYRPYPHTCSPDLAYAPDKLLFGRLWIDILFCL